MSGDCYGVLGDPSICANHPGGKMTSACVMCPYRSNVQWLEIKANPRDWAVAERYDRMIRNARPGFLTFCHPARIPLDAVNFAAFPELETTLDSRNV